MIGNLKVNLQLILSRAGQRLGNSRNNKPIFWIKFLAADDQGHATDGQWSMIAYIIRI
jgi:hypothetical protein